MRKTRKQKRHTASKQYGGLKNSLLQGLIAPKSPLNVYRNFAKKLASPKYFNNNSVFLLSGHSSDTAEPRYKLKGNEFFASPIECGRITLSTALPFLDFAAQNPKIKVPFVEDETSLHPLTYNDFPFRATISRNNTTKKRIKRWEKDSWKLYFPQSSSIGTNTVPQMEFKFFSGEQINTQEDEIVHTYEGEPVEFTFEGKTDYIEPGDYFIFNISISGVLYPNQDVEAVKRKIVELKQYSDIIENTFELPSLPYYYLYLLIPAEDFIEETDHIHNEISYYRYLKEVLITMTSLSYIGLDYWGFDNPETSASQLLLEAKMLVGDIYDFIRDSKSNEPVFLINPLCRDVPSNLEAYDSNYETNVRGLVPNSSRRKRITEKQTRGRP